MRIIACFVSEVAIQSQALTHDTQCAVKRMVFFRYKGVHVLHVRH